MSVGLHLQPCSPCALCWGYNGKCGLMLLQFPCLLKIREALKQMGRRESSRIQRETTHLKENPVIKDKYLPPYFSFECWFLCIFHCGCLASSTQRRRVWGWQVVWLLQKCCSKRSRGRWGLDQSIMFHERVDETPHYCTLQILSRGTPWSDAWSCPCFLFLQWARIPCGKERRASW